MMPEQAARLKQTKERVQQIIADADRFDQATSPGALPVNVDGPTPQIEDEFTELVHRVLGDAFHFMDHVKVPVHHKWKAAYFAALREAIFIYDYGDKNLVENVLARKGKTCQEQVSFNFRYIAQRVSRRIPPRKMLHLRVKAVCDYFMDKTDSKTGKPMFNKMANDMASNVIAALCQGELSDPPGVSWYTPLLMADGKPKIDKEGLYLWR